MRSFISFSTYDSSIWRSTLIIVRFSARPFSGSVGEADAPTFCILPRLARLAFSPLWFSFTRCISPPWIFAFAGFSIVTQGICSDLEGPFLFWCLRRFWRGLRSGQRIFSIASARAGVSVPSDIFRYLHPCCRVFECLTARLEVLLFGGSWWYQCSPWFSGDLQSSRKDCFALVRVSQKFFCQPSLLIVYWQRRSQWAASLLSNGVLM